MQGGNEAYSSRVIDEIVERAQKGDLRSFSTLYEQFYDKILRYVTFKTGNQTDAEDITEEVFLRMLESISAYRRQGYQFSSWLFRIAHNLIIDYFRNKGRRPVVQLEDVTGLTAQNTNMEEQLDMKLQLHKVQEAMKDLTSLQRDVISLRFAGGLSVAETAAVIGKNENAIKALQHAGISNLKRMLTSTSNKSAGCKVALTSKRLADG